jgi:glycosyltransferase involved in cell wall biosynthesis
MIVGVHLGGFVPESGGGYTFQAEVVRSLADLAGETRHRFVLLCPRPEALDPGVRGGLEAAAFPGGPGGRVRSRASRWLAGLARRPAPPNRLDEVARATGVQFLWFAGVDAQQTDLPYVATVWDLQHRLQPWFPEVSAGGVWAWREGFHGAFLRRAAAVITGTEAGRSEVERFYQVPADRILVLPHPTPGFALDAVPGDDGVLSRYGIPPGYLFYPAQFWSHKNHVNLLIAVRNLRDEHGLSLPVVFVGSDKSNGAHVRRVVGELGLASQVHFLGFVPQADLASLYTRAFALTYVSFFGPENLPPLEAFALGCPVIASDVSGAREQLGDAALRVEPADPAQIAEAVRSLHDTPNLRAELIRRGRERAARWTGRDFVRGVLAYLDRFDAVRRCWDY